MLAQRDLRLDHLLSKDLNAVQARLEQQSITQFRLSRLTRCEKTLAVLSSTTIAIEQHQTFDN